MGTAPDDDASVRGLLVRLAEAGTTSPLSPHARDGLAVVRAAHARAVAVPRSRRPLRRLGEHLLSLAHLDGRLVVALEIDVGAELPGEAPIAPRAAGLLLESELRSLLLVGVRPLELGDFASPRSGIVIARGAEVPVVDADALLAAVESLAWAASGAQVPDSPPDSPRTRTQESP